VSCLARGHGEATARTPSAEEGKSAPRGIRGTPAKKRRRRGEVVEFFASSSFLMPPLKPNPLAEKGIPRSASPITRGCGGLPSRIEAQREAQASRSASSSSAEVEEEEEGEEEGTPPPPAPPANATVAAGPGLRRRGHHDRRGWQVLGSTATMTGAVVLKEGEKERERESGREREGKEKVQRRRKKKKKSCEPSARAKRRRRSTSFQTLSLSRRRSLSRPPSLFIEKTHANTSVYLREEPPQRRRPRQRSPRALRRALQRR